LGCSLSSRVVAVLTASCVLPSHPSSAIVLDVMRFVLRVLSSAAVALSGCLFQRRAVGSKRRSLRWCGDSLPCFGSHGIFGRLCFFSFASLLSLFSIWFNPGPGFVIPARFVLPGLDHVVRGRSWWSVVVVRDEVASVSSLARGCELACRCLFGLRAVQSSRECLTPHLVSSCVVSRLFVCLFVYLLQGSLWVLHFVCIGAD
jgi:hypothetical protein